MTQHDGQDRGKAKVVRNVEDADGFRCVDIFERPDGTYGFKEFVESGGRRTLDLSG